MKGQEFERVKIEINGAARGFISTRKNLRRVRGSNPGTSPRNEILPASAT